jgi:hypothetical protein
VDRAELPPLRLISSMITLAAVSPRPEPPYSSGIIAASQPAPSSASTKGLGIGALLVDPAEILVRELAAKVADGVANFLVFVGGVEHGGLFPLGKLGFYRWPGASGHPTSVESDAD